jgi:hypothetical protein
MRNVKIFLAGLVILFASIGCENNELSEDALYMKASLKKSSEMKMVPFKGNFISSPSAPDPIVCSGDNDPATGEPLVAAKINKVEGNATHLGILDDMNSVLIAEDCNLDTQAGILSVTLNITFKNKKGDGIRILGVSNITLEGPASGSYEVIEGFGKFEGATGSITTKGFFNGVTGVAEFRAEGFVTQPNH